MKRRTVLKGLGLGLGAAAGGLTILGHGRKARAAWGEWPDHSQGSRLPEGQRAKNVLEVFMYGGVNAFDSFYTVPEWGVNDQRYLNVYRNETEQRYEQCGLGGELSEPFAEDANGVLVHLGPWAKPLRDRPDITARMRVSATSHYQLAHEGANPLMLSGHRLGSPRLSGSGAAIQRHFLEQAGGARPVPYSWVLFPGVEFPTDNVQAAAAVGLHPGSATPLGLTLSQNSQLAQLLGRDTVADYKDAHDAMLAHYVGRYEQQFRPGGKGKATRSATRDNYAFADFARRQATEIDAVLDPSFFSSIEGSACGTTTNSTPAMQARLAASLLTRQSDDARYVQWIDAGLTPHPGAGHDTHDEHVEYASRNVVHTLEQLVNIINEPGEDDPNKINLDDTLVMITTEFGRTPYADGPLGLNHWPQGFATVMIGGPVQGSSIYGAIDEPTGIGQLFVTPAQVRMAAMLALGIYPFSSETFAVGDVLGAEDEASAAALVTERLLGVTL